MPTQPPVPTATTADDLYREAQKSYEAGDVPTALRLMQQCYQATKSPNLLFNLGQLHRELNHCAEARDHYQGYIVAVPDGEMREVVEEQIAALQKECPPAPEPQPPPPAEPPQRPKPLPLSVSARQPAPVPPAPAPAPPARERHWTPIGWIAAGVGVTATAAAVSFAVKTQQAKDDVEQERESLRNISFFYDDSNIDERNQDFHRNRTLAYVFGAAGAIAIATSIYAFAVAASKETMRAYPVSLTVLSQAASIDCWLSF